MFTQSIYDLPLCEVLPGEEWRNVVGYEGLYLISSFGRVWSIDRMVSCHKKFARHQNGRLLRLDRTKDGHLRALLHKGRGAKKVRRFVHHLVLEAFHGPKPEGAIGCHKDDDPSNNLFNNLYWGTPKSNCADAFRNGKRPVGSQIDTAIFTEDDVRQMRAIYASGNHTYEQVGKMYGTSAAHACHVILRKSWKHVE